jgi:hypothetical protein
MIRLQAMKQARLALIRELYTPRHPHLYTLSEVHDTPWHRHFHHHFVPRRNRALPPDHDTLCALFFTPTFRITWCPSS